MPPTRGISRLSLCLYGIRIGDFHALEESNIKPGYIPGDEVLAEHVVLQPLLQGEQIGVKPGGLAAFLPLTENSVSS